MIVETYLSNRKDEQQEIFPPLTQFHFSSPNPVFPSLILCNTPRRGFFSCYPSIMGLSRQREINSSGGSGLYCRHGREGGEGFVGVMIVALGSDHLARSWVEE
jgi:hypothetical protein